VLVPYPVVALGLRGPCAKYLRSPFPTWSSQKSSGPFHAKMLCQRHVLCASVF